ncbi:MAG: Ger(x)C family spore germination protein [Syntrophomonadaceae bacterium]|nr:Ger(x)C family spore germination protein [Syntrophomonadaceae bacterium]
MGLRANVILVCLLLPCLLCCGCRTAGFDIEELGFVQISAFDRTDDGLIQVSVQIAKPFAITSSAGPPIDEKPYWTVSSTGQTCYQAIRNLSTQSPRIIFWGHNRLTLLGENMAKSGVSEVLDLLQRNHEVRSSMDVMSVRNASIDEVMATMFELERQPVKGFFGLLWSIQRRNSTSFPQSVLELSRKIETEGMEPVIPSVEVVNRSDEETAAPGQLREEVVMDSVRINGMAAFKEDKLVGWLADRESRGVLWVLGKAQRGILVIRDPRDDNNLISIRIGASSSKIVPEIVDDRPVIRVVVEAEGDPLEIDGDASFLHHPEIWASMERRMAAVIRNEIQMALTAGQQQFQSDIFGFGRAFYSKYPHEWQLIKDNWDNIFPTLEVQLDIIANLKEPGLTVEGVRQAQ